MENLRHYQMMLFMALFKILIALHQFCPWPLPKEENKLRPDTEGQLIIIYVSTFNICFCFELPDDVEETNWG